MTLAQIAVTTIDDVILPIIFVLVFSMAIVALLFLLCYMAIGSLKVIRELKSSLK